MMSGSNKQKKKKTGKKDEETNMVGAAKQMTTPFYQESFLQSVKNKEKELFEDNILDDDLSEIRVEIDENGNWMDKNGVLGEFKQHFLDNKKISCLFDDNGLKPPEYLKGSMSKKMINEFYHGRTKDMMRLLQSKFLPKNDKGKELAVNSEGKFCYGHNVIKGHLLYKEIDEVTKKIEENIEEIVKDGIDILRKEVWAICTGRLLMSLLYPADCFSGDWEIYRKHNQLLYSFVVLYRICKHGRKVYKSFVEVGRFIGNSGVKKMKLYTESIASVLNNPEIHDMPVVIVGGFGLPRCGKSFFLNLIIKWCEKYISQTESGGPAPVDMKLDPDDKVTGFKASKGVKPVTSGLWMWREPLILSNGPKKVAVIIVDSEGVGHADKAGESLDLTVPFIVPYLSTICIHHVRTAPLESDIHFHNVSLLIGKELKHNSDKIFGHLIMVYRDSYPEDDIYGFRSELADQDNEQYDTWKDIGNAYVQPKRFYMRDPGEKLKAMKVNEEVKVDDIDKDCMELCYKFCNALFGLNGIAFELGKDKPKYHIKKIQELEESLKNIKGVPSPEEYLKMLLMKSITEKAENKVLSDTYADYESNVDDGRRRVKKEAEKYGLGFVDKADKCFVETFEELSRELKNLLKHNPLPEERMVTTVEKKYKDMVQAEDTPATTDEEDVKEKENSSERVVSDELPTVVRELTMRLQNIFEEVDDRNRAFLAEHVEREVRRLESGFQAVQAMDMQIHDHLENMLSNMNALLEK